MIDPAEFADDPGGRPNHFVHPVLGLCAFRAGQSPEDFVAEMEIARSRPLPDPEPDPRDEKIAALEARLAKLEEAEDSRKALARRD